jgi:hypothetical protein
MNFPFIIYSFAILGIRFLYRNTRFQVRKTPLFDGSELGTSWLEGVLFCHYIL